MSSQPIQPLKQTDKTLHNHLYYLHSGCNDKYLWFFVQIYVNWFIIIVIYDTCLSSQHLLNISWGGRISLTVCLSIIVCVRLSTCLWTGSWANLFTNFDAQFNKVGRSHNLPDCDDKKFRIRMLRLRLIKCKWWPWLRLNISVCSQHKL